MTLKQLSQTGTCDFICQSCPIDDMCTWYNNKENDHIEVNQVELRKQWAKEQLEPVPFEEWAEGIR